MGGAPIHGSPCTSEGPDTLEFPKIGGPAIDSKTVPPKEPQVLETATSALVSSGLRAANRMDFATYLDS